MWVPVAMAWRVLGFADGGDGLQRWSVAVNILNKQSQIADNGLGE